MTRCRAAYPSVKAQTGERSAASPCVVLSSPLIGPRISFLLPSCHSCKLLMEIPTTYVVFNGTVMSIQLQ